MAAVVLDQAAQRLDLRWTIDDPVSLTALITGGAAWAGTYTVESPTASVAAMTATITVGTIGGTEAAPTFTAGAGPDAQLSLTLAAGNGVVGLHPWRLQQVGGVTRLAGHVQAVDGAA